MMRSTRSRNDPAAELNTLTSGDAAAAWAHKTMTIKNTPAIEDAKRIEEVFRDKLASLGDETNQAFDGGEAADPSAPKRPPQARPQRIAKNGLSIQEPRRVRDKEHLRFVARQPCLICGRSPSDPHHLRFAQHRALGRKVSDEFTVPLCRGHHREVHRSGDEAARWRSARKRPKVTARALWLQTHPLPAVRTVSSPDGSGAISDMAESNPASDTVGVRRPTEQQNRPNPGTAHGLA
jgi:hypothetical protein